MFNFEDFTKANSLKILKRFEDSHLSTFLVEEENNQKLVVKFNDSKENLLRIENELDCYSKIDFKKHNINVPNLVDSFKENDTTIIVLEYIEGEDYESKLKNKNLNKKDIKNLSEFIFNIENISFYPTLLSNEKKDQSSDQINNKFYKYAKTWKEESQTKLEQYKIKGFSSFLYKLFETSLEFKIENNGFGGRHGSSKLREFIEKDEKLYVVDWEMATTHYIKYYELAGIIGYIITRTNDLEFANKLILERRNLENNKKHFDKFFKFVLAERLLGDIWDIVIKNILLEEKLNFVKNSWERLEL